MALPRNLNDITAADIEALVAESVPEGSHLDFKRDIPGRDEAARGALVGDASAFANAGGGDLVYGIDEDGEGRATGIVPIRGNPDDEARRIADVLLNGVEPRMPGVHVLPVPLPGGFVLVVRIPQSWAGPHRAKTNQHFYLRDGLRSRKLDVPEVRGLFLRTEAQAQRIRDFRTDRLGKLLAGETPARLVPAPVLMVHFIPTEAALGVLAVDPVPYRRDRVLPALGANVPDARMNLDGALGVRNFNAHGETHGYAQFFRNGFFESVKTLAARDRPQASLGGSAYEQQLMDLLASFRRELTVLGIGTEMACMLSVTRALEVDLGVRNRYAHLEEHQGRFDRETLALPDILLPAGLEPAEALRPVFDLVWQAAGMERSLSYNAAGQWVG